MAITLIPRFNGELRTVMDEATTLIWTLDPAQFPYREGSPLRSDPFQIGNESYEFRIFREVKYFYFSFNLTSNRNHSIRCELMTTTGKSLGCVFHDINNMTSRTNLFVMETGELRHRIGDNEMVKLVTTFLPERPFPSCLGSWTSEDVEGIRKCERLPRVDEDSRDGELKVKTHSSVTAFWSTYPPFSDESAPFYLEQDSFQLWTRQDAAGVIFVGVRRVRCQSKPALTSFRLTVRTIYNEILINIVIQKFDFHMNKSYEGCCMGSRRICKVRNLRITCSLFREDEDCLENASRKGLHSLSRNLKELLVTGQDSDITIEVDKQVFSGHKAILSARCPFFAYMLKSDMTESNTGVIKIPHYSAVEFKEFLLYLYAGRVESFTTEKALSLYRAADEYLVPELKAECLEFLKWDLSVDTFYDIIALSLKYDEKELSQLAKQFFKENSHALVKSESWKMYLKENFDDTFDGPDLEAECLEFPKNVDLPNLTAFFSPTVEEVLQVVVNEATTVVWTLDPGQFLHSEARPHKSELFQVGENSCEFRIFREFEHLYFTLIRHNNRSHSTSVQCALATETGDILDSVLHELHCFTTKTNVFVLEPDELRRSIDDSQTVKLVATFFPKPFFPFLRSAPLEETTGIAEWESSPRMEQDCRSAGLKTKTIPGVNAFWLPDHRRPFWTANLITNSLFSCESEPFDLGEDSFKLWIRKDDAGGFFVGLRSARRLTKRSLTSFRLTVWTIHNELLMSHFLQKFDFHMNDSFEGQCVSSSESSKLLESNGNLRISCSLFQADNDCLENAKRQGLNSLSRDLKELLLTGEASDLTIEVGKEKFFGHRAILNAGCPFFANKLQYDMVEKNIDVVKIPHYNANEFKDLLLYLYTGRVEMFTTEKALSLYRAADEYDLPDLKADCLEFLKWNLSVDSLGDVISVALMYDEKELLQIAKRFFNANFLAVIKTTKWDMFEKENFDEANEMWITAFEARIPKLEI